jgi:hypothetical protein
MQIFNTSHLLVVEEDDHSVGIHGLSLVELEVLELAKEVLHHTVDVLLEGLHLSSPVVILQVLHHLVIKRTASGDGLLEGLHLAGAVVILQVLHHLR